MLLTFKLPLLNIQTVYNVNFTSFDPNGLNEASFNYSTRFCRNFFEHEFSEKRNAEAIAFCKSQQSQQITQKTRNL